MYERNVPFIRASANTRLGRAGTHGPGPMAPVLQHLCRIELFDGLRDDVVQDMLSEAQMRPVRRDDVILAEGMPATALHVLTSGFVRVARTTTNGARMVLRYVGPGEAFGTAALLGNERSSVDAVAVTNGVELQWPVPVMRALVLKHPEAALNAARVLEGRLQEVEGRLGELSNDPVEQRVAQTIIRLVRRLGRRVGSNLEVPFPLTRQDIADMTGTTLHTVSRMLGTWEKQALIERGRQRVVVTDVDAFAALASDGHAGEGSPRRTHRRGGARRSGI